MTSCSFFKKSTHCNWYFVIKFVNFADYSSSLFMHGHSHIRLVAFNLIYSLIMTSAETTILINKLMQVHADMMYFLKQNLTSSHEPKVLEMRNDLRLSKEAYLLKKLHPHVYRKQRRNCWGLQTMMHVLHIPIFTNVFVSTIRIMSLIPDRNSSFQSALLRFLEQNGDVE